MILLDGKKLSQHILDELKQEVAGMNTKLRLAVVVVGKDPVVARYVAQKRKAAKVIGVDFHIYPFEESVSARELRRRLAEIVHEKKNTGVIIQLPLPAHIGRQHMLNGIIPQKDVDVLSARAIGGVVVGKHPVQSPVVGAIQAFFDGYKIDYAGKRIVVLGAGALVGKPVCLWFLGQKIGYTLISTAHTPHAADILLDADIIISGIGKPKFITGDKVKEGVVIIDAGTSESEGKLAGDADIDSLALKCSFITPVPGGVGPMTVAMLFKNLVTLAKLQK
ncbi:MAG: bifunctional 5,10-methylenetetrahydrofolate dehydrogenase/5,10-methenyltetrahydrofolate cyclohydrolase [Candidatus Sungbacteria bacterium]|nr:bifunctional 5,10-methylenetetrahydrofolate dehydrogenase/5,10-methenyltetrahydrofolate cyclohydrolase [bacterium]MDZ4260359.1 bifunctional 5,10-methylenetetrahydrofolate dehydrogenase/5,10-methenyltetrahydrofolate cyclohydrolase [Candidatus Sungbacteria bacterium]